MGEQFPPGIGERQRPPDALEKGNAEIGFERGDLAAKGGLAEAEGARGGRERAGLHRGMEGADLVPVEGYGLPIHAFLYMRNTNLGNWFRVPNI